MKIKYIVVFSYLQPLEGHALKISFLSPWCHYVLATVQKTKIKMDNEALLKQPTWFHLHLVHTIWSLAQFYIQQTYTDCWTDRQKSNESEFIWHLPNTMYELFKSRSPRGSLTHWLLRQMSDNYSHTSQWFLLVRDHVMINPVSPVNHVWCSGTCTAIWWLWRSCIVNFALEAFTFLLMSVFQIKTFRTIMNCAECVFSDRWVQSAGGEGIASSGDLRDRWITDSSIYPLSLPLILQGLQGSRARERQVASWTVCQQVTGPTCKQPVMLTFHYNGQKRKNEDGKAPAVRLV